MSSSRTWLRMRRSEREEAVIRANERQACANTCDGHSWPQSTHPPEGLTSPSASVLGLMNRTQN
eukprot:6190511-Pleurochrysis_carterae.AAC.1